MRMRMIASISLLAVVGCATSSKDIAPISVSPLQYQSYTCEQLGAESARLKTSISQVGGRLDQASSNDAALTGAGFFFFPLWFFLGGTKNQEADFARMAGEYNAVQQAAIGKNCPGIVK